MSAAPVPTPTWRALGAALVVATAAHLGHLPLWAVALVPAAVALRLALQRPLSRKLLIPLVLVTFAAILVRFHSIAGTVAGGSLLAAMTALKVLESANERDAGLLACLAYFQATYVFLATQSIGMAAYVLTSIAVTTYALTLLAAPQGPDARSRARRSLGLLAEALPVMVVLFLLFPRIDSPIWALGGDDTSGVTGLSQSMAPGGITQLTESSAVAFRVEFEDKPPPKPQRYWRGPVFWQYDGRTWSRGEPILDTPPRLEVTGETTAYTVQLEPHNQRWVFGLDMPLPARSEVDGVAAGANLLAEDEVTSVRQYRIRSAFAYRLDADLSDTRRQRALQLPQGAAPQARSLAQKWRQEASGAREIVDRALSYFADNDFAYTLSPPGLGARPVDELLFDTRRGFCEHYASAFAVLMRAAGVPTRVVTGYQGGETNDTGDYMIVRQSDAHAWTEVWLADRGWVRIDPTAQVSRERIEDGVASVAGASERLPELSGGGDGWLRSAALLWDSVNYGWNRFVLGYGPDVQRRLLRHIGLAGWGTYALGVMAVLAAALVLAAVWLFAQRPTAPVEPAQRAWQRALRRLRRAGVAVHANEGPRTLSERVRRERPDLAAAFTPIARLYTGWRYQQPRHRDQLVRDLERAVRDFRPTRYKQPARAGDAVRSLAGKWWPRRRQ